MASIPESQKGKIPETITPKQRISAAEDYIFKNGDSYGNGEYTGTAYGYDVVMEAIAIATGIPV